MFQFFSVQPCPIKHCILVSIKIFITERIGVLAIQPDPPIFCRGVILSKWDPLLNVCTRAHVCGNQSEGNKDEVAESFFVMIWGRCTYTHSCTFTWQWKANRYHQITSSLFECNNTSRVCTQRKETNFNLKCIHPDSAQVSECVNDATCCLGNG